MRETSFPETSLNADWQEDIQFIDDTDGSLVDLTQFTEINIQIWRDTGRGTGNYESRTDDCLGFFDDGGTSALYGTLTGGDITIVSDTTLEFFFPYSSVAGLGRGIYNVGITATDGTFTTQLLLGTVNFYIGLRQ